MEQESDDTGKFYITTPAYYPNDVAHLGHAYTTIAADIIARWNRLCGKDVMFISGLDEHGSKIESSARAKNMSPQKFVDLMAEKFKSTWETLDISLDGFIRTSEDRHVKAVADIFNRINNSGDIYKGEYEGWYCTPCETYWTETQLMDGKCPECGRPVEMLKQESYFFKLSNYQKKLLNLYETNPDFISPESRKSEIINRVREGLRDLSISRTNVKWGIPVPIDKKSTLYVWLDALTFYLSVLGYPDKKYTNYWPADVHLMAKEILWFHAVIWPAMLMSAGLDLPKKVFAHGWLTVNGEKMSKSKGNFIIPEEVVKKYSVDAFRYYLIRDIPFGGEGDYSEHALVARINGELVSDIGNLAYRVLTLAERFDGAIKGKAELDKSLNLAKIKKHMEAFELHLALEEILVFVRACNKYINDNKVWALKGDCMASALYNLLESLRIIAVLISPFMPSTSEKLNEQLGVKRGLLKDCKFGAWKGKAKKGAMLFKKIG